ncbi:hybrid sensor histidine kinase/response regulator [Candidatus Accumulibacter sp. ACC003]|uniref:hybrid sensor histidine kinase/response regulator n=1 Tax=Candidatus Accumulibacter sp. ACC003 TaxID=2823334 RepID=UPI0025BC78BD|nr:hybrid sensor histidine kinase/response regulator [Candidatus Accumulibacter sp. ACC003]
MIPAREQIYRGVLPTLLFAVVVYLVVKVLPLKALTALARVTEDLRQAKDLAEAGSKAKSDFLAAMSHEIRTPMNGILGMNELLRGTPLTLQQQRFADAVHQSGEQLLSIINDILDFSKVEAGKLELESRRFDLRQLLDDIVSTFTEQAAAKGVELSCCMPAELPVAVKGDPVRMRQIMTNLVGNAVKFTSRGEIAIRLDLLDETPLQARVRFNVEDSGIGISEETQGRLFNAFVQADISTTRRYGGSGLGLAIAKQLVEMMHGEIGLHSEAGRGSRFWFEVPLLKQEVGAPSEVAAVARHKDLHVLLVDDHDATRDKLARQLADWSMACTTAASGRSALAELRRPAVPLFDLAIIDLHRPERDGVELAQRIKADPRWAALPVIMLSAADVSADHPNRQHPPIDLCLRKPLRQSDLHDAIATVLSRQAVAAERPPAVPRLPTAEGFAGGAAARVLVVEDNPVNQLVASSMLDSLGLGYSVAENGQVALDRLSREPYDLVLMDCQMPVLDGFEATAQVRAWQRDGRLPRRLPIIALTANAVDGDRERCLAAGMDDYVSKPFTRARLAATLQRWLPDPAPANATATASTDRSPAASAPGSLRSGQASATTQDQPPPATRATAADASALTAANEANAAVSDDAPDPPPAYDPSVVQALPMVADGSNPAFAERLLEVFAGSAEQLLTSIEKASTQGDTPTLQRSAHSLKSSSVAVGALALSEQARQLEMLLRAGGDAATDWPTVLRQSYSAFELALTRHRTTPTSHENKPSTS